MQRVILLLALMVICVSGGTDYDEVRGTVRYKAIVENVTSLYNVTKQDVLNYTMKTTENQKFYLADFGLDGDISTQAQTAYGGRNRTYWAVKLRRSYTIIKVYAMGINYKDVNLTLNVSLDGDGVGIYRFDKMIGSWTYKVCDVNTTSSTPVIGDTVQLQKYGYGFYLYEAVIQAQPYIDVGHLEVSSMLNRTSMCWQTVILWQVDDQCCSGDINITMYENSNQVPYITNSTMSTTRHTELLIHECVGALETNNYTLQLNNDQMSKNISFNYTSPLIDQYLIKIDSYDVAIFNTSTSMFRVTFPLPDDPTKLIPNMYTASLLHGGRVERRQLFTCDDENCHTEFDDLVHSTPYSVDVVCSTEFAGQEFNTSSDPKSVTTLDCSDPDPVAVKGIKILLENKYDIDLKVKFKPGDPHCSGNNTYIMYAESHTAPTEEIFCDSMLFYCNAPLEAGTVYNITIETTNAMEYGANTTVKYTTPTRAPSPPVDVKYNLSFNQTTISWSPPEKPRGVITSYLVSFQHLNKTDGVNMSHHKIIGEVTAPGNTTHLVINYTEWGSTLTLKVKAMTDDWGRFSPSIRIDIPYKNLPTQLIVDPPVFSYQSGSDQSSTSPASCLTASYHLWWNDSILHHPEYKIYTKMSCSNSDSSDEDNPILSRFNFTEDSITTLCDLNPAQDYDCLFHTIDHYGNDLRPTQIVSWKAPMPAVVTSAPAAQMPEETVTLIVVGVAVTVIFLAIVLISLLIVRQKKRAIAMSEADSYFSLISSEYTSSLSELS